MRRPSPATAISLAALVFAMSGTAVAATGGDFILGKSNTAASVTSLSNAKGTALSLSSAATAPPLKVSNSVQVPNLNASELDGQAATAFLGVNGTAADSAELGGQPASAYLGVTGTAANSSELGGTPASGFVQGGGTISGGRASLSPGGITEIASAPGSYILAICNSGPDDNLQLVDSGNTEVATWYNTGGVGQATLSHDDSQSLDGSSPVTTMIWVQVDTGSSITSYTLTESANSTAGTCYVSAQAVTSNG